MLGSEFAVLADQKLFHYGTATYKTLIFQMYYNIQHLNKLPGLTYNTQFLNIDCSHLSLESLEILLLHSFRIGPAASSTTPLHYEVISDSCNVSIWIYLSKIHNIYKVLETCTFMQSHKVVIDFLTVLFEN